MTRGLGAGPVGPLTGKYDAPPDDTGEAVGLDPANLAANDLLSEYLQHVGSGLWAVPPGVRDGEFVGQALFA